MFFVYSIYICTSRLGKTASQQAETAVEISGGTQASVNQKQDVSWKHWKYCWNILDRGIIGSCHLVECLSLKHPCTSDSSWLLYEAIVA